MNPQNCTSRATGLCGSTGMGETIACRSPASICPGRPSFNQSWKAQPRQQRNTKQQDEFLIKAKVQAPTLVEAGKTISRFFYQFLKMALRGGREGEVWLRGAVRSSKARRRARLNPPSTPTGTPSKERPLITPNQAILARGVERLQKSLGAICS